jgi:hypothetical protein
MLQLLPAESFVACNDLTGNKAAELCLYLPAFWVLIIALLIQSVELPN